MHETRYDWLADRWVIFAPNREHRPNEYCETKKPAEPFKRSASCPFCSGSENETPDPTLVLPASEFDSTQFLYRNERRLPRDDWKVRVVPNKYPAISKSESCGGEQATHGHSPKGHSLNGSCCGGSNSANGYSPGDYSTGKHLSTGKHGLNGHSGAFPISGCAPHLLRKSFLPSFTSLGHDVFSGESALQSVATILGGDTTHLFQREVVSGVHEVIIESPNHVDSLTELPDSHVELILSAYQQRMAHWRSQSGLQYAVVFKNYGADAGASLSHSHSQLMCLDFTPSNVDWTYRRLSDYHRQYHCCYYCQIIGEELKSQERIVHETDHFVVVCPFASRFPYCFSIVPRKHRAHFDEIDPQELQDLASTLRRSLQSLERSRPLAAYNFIVQTAPFQSPDYTAHHWRLRVIPRLNKIAGFEWGSDCFINTVVPETAAETLRSNWPSD